MQQSVRILKSLSRFKFVLHFCFAFLFCAAPAFAEEQILSYLTGIFVNADSSLNITESITVRAEGYQIKRGIYRDFPTRYRARDNSKVVVGFEVTEVLRDGRPEPFHVVNQANGKRIYIGSENVFLPEGTYTYKISYRTTRQLGFFADHDELYFNAIGHGWEFPILHAQVKVVLPDSVSSESIHFEGYGGVQGSKAQDFIARLEGRNIVSYLTRRPLAPKEGLSVVVTWPKGAVTAPTTMDKVRWFVEDNRDSLAFGIGYLFILAYYLFTWLAVGQDPDKGVIFPQYKAPDDITPAEARYLYQMGFDTKCVMATVVDFAVQGLATIDVTGSWAKSYTINKTGKEPPAHSKHIFENFFGIQSTIELEKGNHSEVKRALDSIKELVESKHLNSNVRFNTGKLVIGVLLSIVSIILTVVIAGDPEQAFHLANGIIFLLNIGTIVAFARYLKAPTKSGQKLRTHLDGYRMYLKTAEEDRFRVLEPEKITPEVFERHLPYALALGAEEEWSKALENALAASGDSTEYQPRWYRGDRDNRFSSNTFSSLGSSLSSSIASSSTPPGSSSGSGGGGSSGGGGGGGGGGGW